MPKGQFFRENKKQPIKDKFNEKWYKKVEKLINDKNDSKNKLKLKNGCFSEKLIVGKVNDDNYKKLGQNYANYELYINVRIIY